MIEGYIASKRYMIVDDFVFSGGTIDRIREAVAGVIPLADLVGVVLYATTVGVRNTVAVYDKGQDGISKRREIPALCCKPPEKW